MVVSGQNCCPKPYVIKQMLGLLPSTPSETTYELREDGGRELREDGTYELRQ